MRMPLTAVNNLLCTDDVASAVAILVFCQYFGGALLLSLGQTVLLGRLGPALQPTSVLKTRSMLARPRMSSRKTTNVWPTNC
jgi:hypothetical protein